MLVRRLRIKKPRPLGRKATNAIQIHKPSPITAGFPDFWQTAHDEMPEFFTLAFDLAPLVRRVVGKSIEGQLAIVLNFHAAIVADSFGAMLVLCLNGYCHDAVVLARSMFEYMVNARYLLLRATPAELEDYLYFHWVRQKKHLDYLTKFSPEDAQRISASRVRSILAEFAKVEHRFTRANGKGLRNSWSIKSFRERAEEVGMGVFYPTFYAMASGLAHGDISVLDARSATDALSFVSAPSVSGMKKALWMGHYALLHTLVVLNDSSALGFGSELMEAFENLERICEGNKVD